MSDFVNTIDLLGDDVVAASIISGTITEFNDDVITSIGERAFYTRKQLKTVNVPNVTTVGGDGSFGYCTALTCVDLASATSLTYNAFSYCSKLATLVLRSETLCALSSGALTRTPFSNSGYLGTAYVPQALIEEYQNATNWSTLYAAGTCNFVAIEGSEYE